jgi:predicted DNA-binding protein (MmcQ/YjbR family)
LNTKGIYEAYHMNKKNWITIIFDETLKDSEIESLVDKSYNSI